MERLGFLAFFVLLQIILVAADCGKNHIWHTGDDDHPPFCDFQFVLHEESGKCHKLGERGPCRRGATLEFTECDYRKGVCVPTICPEDWVYHNQTRKCYKELKQGPCGKLAFIVSLDGGRYKQLGKCQCEHEVCNLHRPRVYWDKPYRCYHIFDQGPCKEGEWLVPDSDTSAICEPCPCWENYLAQERPADKQPTSASESEDRSHLFSHEGKCYRTLRKGFPGCPRGQKVYFDAHADHFNPLCDPDPEKNIDGCVLGGGVSQRLKCDNGSDPDNLGGCNPKADF